MVQSSNWKRLSNNHDMICSLPILVVWGSVDRGLNELSNDLLRHDGLAKQMELNTVDEEFIQSVSDWHNHISPYYLI
ncbi:hypothetical protein [Dolosigranulum pigrum]|uniref:hypothetical protein n=1 Tax=Dolosigranulum pigrum TaxID=29394 RepID=UPI001AD89074|nr:hypothetical protein [Dolosigranulum pigrum]